MQKTTFQRGGSQSRAMTQALHVLWRKYCYLMQVKSTFIP